MSSRLRLTAGTATVAAALALGACGGGDKAPSKAEYVKDANKRCAAYNAQVAKGAKSLSASSSDAQIAAFMRKTVVPGTTKVVSELKDLKRPKGDEDTIDAIYAAVDAGLAKVKAASSDKELAKLAKSSDDPFKRANELSNAYGLKECGS